MADAIENHYYKIGKREDTIKQIKTFEPDFDKTYMTTKDLEKYYEDLIEKSVTNKTKRINNEEGD